MRMKVKGREKCGVVGGREGRWCQTAGAGYGRLWWVKRAMEEDDDEAFQECFQEGETWTPSGVIIVAMRLQDEESEEDEDLHEEAYEDAFVRVDAQCYAGSATGRPEEENGPAASRPCSEMEDEAVMKVHLEEDVRKENVKHNVWMLNAEEKTRGQPLACSDIKQ